MSNVMTPNQPARAGFARARPLWAAAAFTAALAAAPIAQAQPIDLTMGIIVSPGDTYSALMPTVPDRIAKATNGRVKVTVSDSLAAPGQIASAVRDGRLPMSAAVHTYLAADDPRMGIFNLPGLIDDIREYQKVRDAFWGKDVAATWLDKWNAIVLAEGAWCTTHLFSKKAVRTAEDFRGLRIRVHNPQTAAQLSALGAKPTPMPTTEIMPALERGVIDGALISACVGGAMEFWRVAKNVQNFGIGPVTGWAVLINKGVWDGLPADVRDQIGKAMKDLEKEGFREYDAFVGTALKKMKEQGVETWVAPDNVRKQVNSAQVAKAAYDAWYSRATAVGIDGPAYVKRVREALGKPE